MGECEISCEFKKPEISAALDQKIQELTREVRDRVYTGNDPKKELDELLFIRDVLFGEGEDPIPYGVLLTEYGISNHTIADTLFRNYIIDEDTYQKVKPTKGLLPARRHKKPAI